ncbi:glycerol-3-phosphate dehydrogenase [Jeongeupia naejangsanensis]|uniref:Glycerol-3-phosphate dehydrogenase n=1 Tax=Jeongeupia naejangsanensis TaxID=613195 RepID=A0ABS2BKS4_9NEIS|nr:glycerol-3-phosphate dehydrogenase [Jeongeupia naejangsanensis]MBM3116217.1 glycerol-3-phosphate dehydrogenase [Jeongeupia naejangsanensis]
MFAQSIPERCDLLIVGGGINGAGIARDAAGRGLSVVLCEQDDLAGHTSSASTKLIHGGLRYLEYREFGLVRKALQERETLLRMAPHIIWPLRFIMPHDAHQRPAWLIRTGLFLYDHLANRRLLQASLSISLTEHVAGGALKPALCRGFEYSDGWVDDARLVVLNALDAYELGAVILPRTRCSAIAPAGDRWSATLRTAEGGSARVDAAAIVNAAGPWAAELARLAAPDAERATLRLIKGSHIVVPRLFDHPYAYLFQNPDKRIIFAIPFQREFTLIGTTDVDFTGDPARVAISDDEERYLCEMASRYFARPVTPAQIVWRYSGVRPLLDDEVGTAAAVTRDYRLQLSPDGPPLLHVWGGKITTYRRLAEDAVTQLLSRLGRAGPAWTAARPLPGGDFDIPGVLSVAPDFDAFLARFRGRHPWIPDALSERYCRLYGSRAERLIGDAVVMAQLGTELVPGLYEAEARYLIDNEWARSSEDLLWRRTKLGLHCLQGDVQRLDAWLAKQAAETPSRLSA